jgi:hypothetical protein
MSQGNGEKVLKIDTSSVRTFEFPGGYRYACDVIWAYDRYWDVRRQLEGPDGKVPPEQHSQLNENLVAFVRQLLEGRAGDPANQGKPVPAVDAGLALRFVKMLSDENRKLADFFVPESHASASSPGRTELIFSTSKDN